MENGVPAPPAERPGSVAARSVDRALAARRDAYAQEVRRLIDASFSLIRTSGELEPRVSAIVEAAGLSNQAFYRHFRSKDELLLATLDEGVALLAEHLRRRMEAAADPLGRVRAWMAGVLEQALDPRAAEATRPFAVSRARLARRFPAELAASERQLVAPLAEALASAGLGVDPERDADAVYTLAMGWLERRLAQAEPASRAEAEHLVAFALRGLGAER